MNPNSKNQNWSKWTFKVSLGDKRPGFEEVKYNAAVFGRKVFGSVSQMRVYADFVQNRNGKFSIGWVIEVLTEGHPAHDREFVNAVCANWVKNFFTPGFGSNAHIDCEAKVMAGDPQNGKPADQMIILPALKALTEV